MDAANLYNASDVEAAFAELPLQFRTVYNVKWYRAVGDGVTDDTSAIQAAIVAASSGGTVYFPVTSGNYVVSTLYMARASAAAG